MKQNEKIEVSATKQEQVLTDAVRRAADHLNIKASELSEVLGLSMATISRMNGGSYTLRSNKKEFELGLEFVRLFRGIDAISGGDDRTSRSWLRVPNKVLRKTPIELIKSIKGLVDTVAYVDTFRAKI